jgi:hypothetical protein
MTNRRQQIIGLLKSYPDGLTLSQMARKLGCDNDAIRQSVLVIPSVYVDRWVAVRNPVNSVIAWMRVYCIVDVPDDAPMPEREPTEKDLM